MAIEAEKLLPDGLRQELETAPVAGDWRYLDWVAEGAYDEDRTDHLYVGYTDDQYAIRSIPHYWDADEGPEHMVKGLDGTPEQYPNANQKARDMFAEALRLYDPSPGANNSEAYERLGHVAHLVGDMGLPCHVHEDFHPGYFLELTDIQRRVSLGDEDSWEDDSMEQWIFDYTYSDGRHPYQDYSAESAATAGGMVTFPDEVIAEAKWRLDHGADPDAGWKYYLYYLMYTTNQRADFFASDEYDGDLRDPEGWMGGFLDLLAIEDAPRVAGDLEDNDHGFLGDVLTDNDNNADGDLARIEAGAYLYAIRAIATLYKLFYECTHAPNVDLSIVAADRDLDNSADYRYVSLDVTYLGADGGYYQDLEVGF
jgi:hypothetical protein